mmetsp:Transcript_1949/g.4196  ORF Transcript_1949/g.4196 Transcript_1949/m.4196 type:complete len:207 (+) Transcript_1949:874-1494(+)
MFLLPHLLLDFVDNQPVCAAIRIGLRADRVYFFRRSDQRWGGAVLRGLLRYGFSLLLERSQKEALLYSAHAGSFRFRRRPFPQDPRLLRRRPLPFGVFHELLHKRRTGRNFGCHWLRIRRQRRVGGRDESGRAWISEGGWTVVRVLVVIPSEDRDERTPRGCGIRQAQVWQRVSQIIIHSHIYFYHFALIADLVTKFRCFRQRFYI